MTGKWIASWSERHHVVSLENTQLYYRQRKYFDQLPRVSLDAARTNESRRRQPGKEQTSIESCLSGKTAGGSSSSSRARAVQPSRTVVRKPKLLEGLDSLHSADPAVRPKLQAFGEFYKWCIKKFGNLTRAWRKMDRNLDMKITWFEFSNFMRDNEYKGDVKGIFKLLDRDHTDALMYYHFDPAGALELGVLKVWANEYGGMRKAFEKLDSDHSGILTLEELRADAKRHGFSNPDAVRSLFGMLDLDRNKMVTLDEVTFLDNWACPVWLTVEPDHVGAQNFVRCLIGTYGDNGIRAWRVGIDHDGSMRVSWNEFERTNMQNENLHYTREQLVLIWRALDDNLSGWISLREFHSESYQLLSSFKEYCMENFGSARNWFQDLCEEVKNSQEGPDRNVPTKSVHRRDIESAVMSSLDLDEGKARVLSGGLCVSREGGSKNWLNEAKIRFLDQWRHSLDQQEEAFWSAAFPTLLLKEPCTSSV